MTVWVVRAGRRGEDAESVIAHGISAVDFNLPQSALDFATREALQEHLSNSTYADESSQSAASAARQLWTFANEIQVGEFVVQPQRRPKRVISIGKVAGPYQFRPDQKRPHTRPVEWVATDIPRLAFDADLLEATGRRPTVFPVNAADAEARINQMVDRQSKNSESADAEHPVAPVEDLTPADFGEQSDLEEQIEDRIIERIRQKFPGVRLEYLVTNILQASGYNALQTRPGPDGGVDVVAGRGEMGFDQPRLCVQVKSGSGPVGVADYNRLQGNIQSYGADHGLLVSLGDFTKTVRNENERSFFKIRLWGPEEIAARLLETYDRLPDDIRQDVPLKNRRILVETDL